MLKPKRSWIKTKEATWLPTMNMKILISDLIGKLDRRETAVLYFIYTKIRQNIRRLMKPVWRCKCWITARLYAGVTTMQDYIVIVPVIYMICWLLRKQYTLRANGTI